MLSNQKVILLIYFIFLFISCDDNSIQSGDTYSVSGNVYYTGNVIGGVKVSIDDDQYTNTDELGYFIFKNISRGSHQLKMYLSFTDMGNLKKTSQDSSDVYVERTYEINVVEDMILNSLKLPKAVLLEIQQSDTNSVVTWSSSDAEDFREYKLYRHISSGLDETTGELVHVSTSIDDTTYAEQIFSLDPSTYFYRVYVMNDYGRLGGSNIVDMEILETILKIIINYTGQYTVNANHSLYVGVSGNPCGDDFQDEGQIWANNSYIEIYVPEWFEWANSEPQEIYGPYYIGSFLDITGEHQGSSILPNGCPYVIYDGIDPLVAKSECNATPVYIRRGTLEEVIVEYGDDYIINNN